MINPFRRKKVIRVLSASELLEPHMKNMNKKTSIVRRFMLRWWTPFVVLLVGIMAPSGWPSWVAGSLGAVICLALCWWGLMKGVHHK